MNIAIRFISLILVCLPLVVHSDVDVSSKGPGKAACVYYGDIDDFCNITTVNPDQIPEGCSSIIFNTAEVDTVNHTVSLSLDSQIENLNALLACKKKVFIYYEQTGYIYGWPDVLKCNTVDGGQSAKDEMVGLKAFLDQYPGISGLVLNYVDPGVFPDDYPCPTENFKIYLEVLRCTFPDLIIGFEFDSKDIIDYNFNPIGQWVDFSIIDPLIDFYLINMFSAGKCTSDLLKIGGFPLNGKYTYTVEKTMACVAQVNIPSEKCLIQFTISAVPIKDKGDPCAMSNTMMCTDPSGSRELCTENLVSFFEKGQYVAQNAMGFSVDCIDADDPGGVCCCPSGPFPSFHALLDGLNGVDTPPCCQKYEMLFGP